VPLESHPRAPLLKTLTLHHEVRHHAQGSMMLLGAFPGQRRVLARLPVACLTGLEAQVAYRMTSSTACRFVEWARTSRVPRRSRLGA
jgi:hypothetical protein